ncbi:MAG: pyrroline-5-carboxylate reductase, partial [Sphaerochaetaceae bacterium]|nr:pyrroline-5-carboxylate reductase [Sphaerochaetaceae bacterium]
TIKLIIAVKPQVLPSLYSEIKQCINKCGKKDLLVISIAAGVPLETLVTNLEYNNIVRFMPNIAAKVKKAVTAIAYNKGIDSSLKKIAFETASSFGEAFELDEKLFPAFIGISGSAIAIVLRFIHEIALGGCLEGIPYNQAVSIASSTLISGAELQKQTKENPEALMTKVCSAGGTTIESVKALEKNGFNKAVIEAVVAASEKTKEMDRKA